MLGTVFSFTGLLFTTSRKTETANWTRRIFQIVAVLNCVLATYIVVWLTKRFKKPGMSSALKREIRARYIEYVVLFVLFNWQIGIITKPSYRFVPSLEILRGGTYFVGVDLGVDSVF